MSKPTKTAEQLRAMIMQEVSAHAFCADQIDDVVILGDGDGSWRISSVNWKVQEWRECRQVLDGVASRLRGQYDLA